MLEDGMKKVWRFGGDQAFGRYPVSAGHPGELWIENNSPGKNHYCK